MANNKKSSQYNIELKLSGSKVNKAVLDELNKSFDGLDNKIKKTTEESLRDLNASFDKLLQSTEDVNELESQYGKVIDDNIDKIKSEIDALEAKKVNIAASTDLTETQRDAAIQILETQIKQKKQETELLKIEKAKAKLGNENAFLIAEILDVQQFDERNLKGLCPFHDEDTPSFVYNKKNYTIRDSFRYP